MEEMKKPVYSALQAALKTSLEMMPALFVLLAKVPVSHLQSVLIVQLIPTVKMQEIPAWFAQSISVQMD